MLARGDELLLPGGEERGELAAVKERGRVPGRGELLSLLEDARGGKSPVDTTAVLLGDEEEAALTRGELGRAEGRRGDCSPSGDVVVVVVVAVLRGEGLEGPSESTTVELFEGRIAIAICGLGDRDGGISSCCPSADWDNSGRFPSLLLIGTGLPKATGGRPRGFDFAVA